MTKPDVTIRFSGLLDTRNAIHFDGKDVVIFPNVDLLYGPYSSKEEAYEALSTPNSYGFNALTIGKTVGIVEQGQLSEYWFKSACDSPEDLVLKGSVVTEVNLDVPAYDLYVLLSVCGVNSQYVGFRYKEQDPEDQNPPEPSDERYALEVSKITDGFLISYSTKIADWTIELIKQEEETVVTKDESYVLYSFN